MSPASAGARNDVRGGAAATGDGDQLMRLLPSFTAVNYMRMGMGPKEACEKALEPVAKYYPHASGAVVCLSASGEFGAAMRNMEWGFPYSVQADYMADAEVFRIEPPAAARDEKEGLTTTGSS